jgi:hypothetical protein
MNSNSPSEANPASKAAPKVPRKRHNPTPSTVDAATVLSAFRAAEFEAMYLPEPLLLFGDGRREPDPKSGLALHKPYDLRTIGRRDTIRLGVVGNGAMIFAVEKWLERSRGLVLPIRQKREKGKVVPKPMDSVAYPPFPGLAEAFETDVVIGDNMTATLTNVEIDAILALEFFEQRVTRLVQVVASKLTVLAEGMHRPDVIIIALPTEVRAACTIPAHHKTRSKTKRTLAHALKETLEREKAEGQSTLFDISTEESAQIANIAEAEREAEKELGVFHHGLKVAAMQLDIPVQLTWQSALEGSTTVEDDATRAWNFWTGVYYKAGGIPWRVSGLEPGTCYVGFAFYRDRKDGTLRTSIAQAFTDRAEGIVLRSEPFVWREQERSRTPHMPKELTSSLLTSVIGAYKGVHDQAPNRIVVHKWQRYSDEEKAGLIEAITAARIHAYDLVAFGDRDIRFFRCGAEPVIRGTMITLPDTTLLYTRGFVPYVSEYSGMRVPRPLELVEHHGSSSKKKVCEEILALTKMDWNSAVFAQKEPITTAFSHDVGEILAEVPMGVQPKTLYRFYM